MTNYRIEVQSKSGEWINYACNVKESIDFCQQMAEFALSDAQSRDYDCDNYHRARVVNEKGEIVLQTKKSPIRITTETFSKKRH